MIKTLRTHSVGTTTDILENGQFKFNTFYDGGWHNFFAVYGIAVDYAGNESACVSGYNDAKLLYDTVEPRLRVDSITTETLVESTGY